MNVVDYIDPQFRIKRVYFLFIEVEGCTIVHTTKIRLIWRNLARLSYWEAAPLNLNGAIQKILLQLCCNGKQRQFSG